ncbi:hypothetical protein AWB69_00721 [Caballeronia udeis]|uniref:Uncharacterized protein n=2 Tax=Caballeronia udeis TaxID=1232866 RepID=A0A158F6A5_9BURK|nr:hypothetical protein AWB69_00721 [Caballeronia udeis]
MTVKDDDLNVAGGRRPVDEGALIAAIEALEPNEKQRKTDLFRKALPAILAAEKRGVPKSRIILVLKDQGLHLSIGGYNSLREKMVPELASGGDGRNDSGN